MANERKVLNLIERAAKERWTEFNLIDNHLTSVPPEIAKLRSLTSLFLWNNQLASLPPEIAELTSLTSLILRKNQLASLPPEIAKLTSLTSLVLSNNQLKGLPPEIAQLTNLTSLWIDSNQLTSLPREISNLINLTSLILNNNQLTSLPPEITRLIKLTILKLSNNKLVSLPAEIDSLTQLANLDLSHNLLTSVPPEITKLSKLTYLDLSHNLLTSVLPEITKLSKLAYLDLSGNALPISPETLANPNDVKAIFAALTGLISGEQLNEAKMLVVGDGKVGKSSVVERLLYDTFNPQNETTLGVDINDEMKIVQSEVKGEGEPIKLNIWDFGGQEIQHSTHQFFLTTRSLYLLVMDARKGDQLNNIEYWLKLIESFGGDSPIIIVINQIDQLKGQRPLNLDRKSLQAKYHIRDFVETSCATGEGMPALKTAIARAVGQMTHVRDIWPREWLAVKRRLREMRADYIPIEKYIEICGEENLDDEDLQQSLLGLLHDLGVVIRLSGDTEVLNPRWVTQGVYGVLTSAYVIKRHGQFDLNNMGEILAGLPDANVRYPPHTHRRLIDVMRHFELCFEFTDRRSHYLIPQHLDDNELDIPWDDAEALKFQYHYEILPNAIISRFIVRMNQYIRQQYYWKNGIFLHDGENRARIKADLIDRKIFISVTGKEKSRRAFLAVIRFVFDEINSNFSIEIKQMIPLPGAPQVLVSYQDLIAYEEMNEPQIIVPELRKKFSVRELLDGVEDLNTRIERRERDLNEKRFPQRLSDETQAIRGLRILRIVVASPSDVQPERNVLPSVLKEINRSVAADRGLHLELSQWETDTYPGFHTKGPQGLIDSILNITDCDLLIGIFWKRFGTPTSDGQTGTEHEFNVAYKAWQEKGRPQIFVYFNQKPHALKSKAEVEQLGQVLDFREGLPKEALWWPYEGKTEFEKLIRNHLINYIRNFSWIMTDSRPPETMSS
ncbi:MAG TPA: COR domain-containing protein [Blastocatellia bacterium]|nr:COR domain-containing protein [Blastocatellia bacterium]